ncbi:hypothetical protein [Streptomyces sp. NPDC088910]|uniref:hypothetical protein n=1 Tax=Streptomyces sp. NPDC088910 TaxID=3365911 RepID=UPI003808776E
MSDPGLPSPDPNPYPYPRSADLPVPPSAPPSTPPSTPVPVPVRASEPASVPAQFPMHVSALGPTPYRHVGLIPSAGPARGWGLVVAAAPLLLIALIALVAGSALHPTSGLTSGARTGLSSAHGAPAHRPAADDLLRAER